ncbi:MAG: hypothetical protein HIU81_07790 [Acidobacteria bacterium]|nr:hypothetical protein [Acidobacteriota bacterium]
MTKSESFLNKFMKRTDTWARTLTAPHLSDEGDTAVVHKHDEFEEASAEDLSHFEVETDSEGHHYATRHEG